jgi:integrase
MKNKKIQSITKKSKGKASISCNNGYLRISLPRKLFDGKQKYISLNLQDTPDNRAKPQLRLKLIQRDIEYEEFDFTLLKYSSNASKVLAKEEITIEDMLNNFEEKYFFTRKRNRQSLNTCKNLIQILKRNLISSLKVPLNEEIITEAIKASEAGSAKRLETLRGLSMLCKLFEFQYNFQGLAKGYKTKSKDLPEDEAIKCAFKLIQENPYFNCSKHEERAKSWGWILMVLATYGLRPHEIFAIDYSKSFKSPLYELVLDEHITDGIKTGSRLVFPVPINWVTEYELFDVKNEVLTNFINKNLSITVFSLQLNRRLKNKKKLIKEQDLQECLDFAPYDLRHRYAIRGHELGYPVEAMARWMGHSVQMHTQTYHKHLKSDTDKKVFEGALLKAQEFERLQERLLTYEELETELKLAQEKIKFLEEENTILKQKLELKF